MAATAIRTFLSSKIVHHLPLYNPITQLHYTQLPPVIDLRPHKNMPPVYDQGLLCSSTANALVASFQYEDPAFFGSRLFLHYNERLVEKDISEDEDEGAAQFHNGIKSLGIYGVCGESDWPYDISKFDEKPPPLCYQEAVAHKATQVQNIRQDANSMKNCLHTGLPIVVGIQVFEEFESQAVAQSGIVPMPTPTSKCIGGHAVLVVGYDDTQQQWIVRNSWGADWGDHGYFYLPYLYLLDASLASDLWSVNRVSHPPTPPADAAPSNSNQKLECTISSVLGDTLNGAVSGAVSGAITGVMSGMDHDHLQAALSGALLGATGGGISGAITSSQNQGTTSTTLTKNKNDGEDENKKLKQSAPL
jgi:hypothetical protein